MASGSVSSNAESLGTASMVCGILGCIFGIPSIPAVILGRMAQKRRREGGLPGLGSATAGLIMGWIVIIGGVLAAAIMVFMLVAGYSALQAGQSSAAGNASVAVQPTAQVVQPTVQDGQPTVPAATTNTCPVQVDPGLNALTALNSAQLTQVVTELMAMRVDGFREGNADCLTDIYVGDPSQNSDLGYIAGGKTYPNSGFTVLSVTLVAETTTGYDLQFTGTSSNGSNATFNTVLEHPSGTWRFDGLTH